MKSSSGVIGVLRWLVLVFLAIGAFVALFLYLRDLGNLPPSSWQNPPIYPKAQNVLLQDTPDKGKFCFFGCTWTVLSFQTDDSAEMVLEYYSQILSKGGARENPSEEGRIYYGWLKGNRVYSVWVLTRPGDSGQTDVEVEFIHMVGD